VYYITWYTYRSRPTSRRILFAVDGVEPPLMVWVNVMSLPLEPVELRTIASNLAPYFR